MYTIKKGGITKTPLEHVADVHTIEGCSFNLDDGMMYAESSIGCAFWMNGDHSGQNTVLKWATAWTPKLLNSLKLLAILKMLEVSLRGGSIREQVFIRKC